MHVLGLTTRQLNRWLVIELVQSMLNIYDVSGRMYHTREKLSATLM